MSDSIRDDGETYSPATLVDFGDGRFSLLLSDFEAGYPLSDERGLQGGGYTWQGIVEYLVESRAPDCAELVSYDCEGDTFVAVSRDPTAIKRVAELLHRALHDPALLREAFDRAPGLE